MFRVRNREKIEEWELKYTAWASFWLDLDHHNNILGVGDSEWFYFPLSCTPCIIDMSEKKRHNKMVPPLTTLPLVETASNLLKVLTLRDCRRSQRWYIFSEIFFLHRSYSWLWTHMEDWMYPPYVPSLGAWLRYWLSSTPTNRVPPLILPSWFSFISHYTLTLPEYLPTTQDTSEMMMTERISKNKIC